MLKHLRELTTQSQSQGQGKGQGYDDNTEKLLRGSIAEIGELNQQLRVEYKYCGEVLCMNKYYNCIIFWKVDKYIDRNVNNRKSTRLCLQASSQLLSLRPSCIGA